MPLIYGAGDELVVVHVQTSGAAEGMHEPRNAVFVCRMQEGMIVETWKIGETALDAVFALSRNDAHGLQHPGAKLARDLRA